jgi:SHS2 domain-containing protein
LEEVVKAHPLISLDIMVGFELLDHTADVIIRAYGESWKEVFEELGKAMFSAVLNLSKVEPKECRSIELSSDSLEDLVVDYLNELLLFKDAENLAFSLFDVEVKKENRWVLRGKICGEKIDIKKHQPHGDVKAVSYHMLEVGEREGKKYAQVVLDLPKNDEEWLIPFAKYVKLDEIKFPIILVQEYGINI